MKNIETAIIKESIEKDADMYAQALRVAEQEAHNAYKQWLQDSVHYSRCYK